MRCFWEPIGNREGSNSPLRIKKQPFKRKRL
jgi:hypothetical protein